MSVSITFDETKSRQRSEKLQSYCQEKVLSQEKVFICQCCPECERSVTVEGRNLIKGQLSHVGSRYDTAINGAAFRLVVSGLQFGGREASVDMQQRSSTIVTDCGINSRYYKNLDPGRGGRNQHMRGTALLLKYLLGKPVDRTNYSAWGQEFLGEAGNESAHMFNHFALVNIALCSAIWENSARGRPTSVMANNCFSHYFETLKILDPTLVVFQGIGGTFSAILKRHGMGHMYQMQNGIGEFSGKDLKFFTCEFCHPSAVGEFCWGDNPFSQHRPYWTQTVVPTLDHVRKRLGLPDWS